VKILYTLNYFSLYNLSFSTKIFNLTSPLAIASGLVKTTNLMSQKWLILKLKHILVTIISLICAM